jgi:bifunctional non-homologous end joining protein LigD
LAAGRLSIVLHGRKLRGEFSLVKLKRGEENAWLLMKKHDAFATTDDVTADERSVQSGLTLDEVGRKPVRAKRASRVKKSAANMPHEIQPMLATLVDEPFDRAGWLFEVKWDGYRAIAEIDSDDVRLYSRNHKSFADKFAPVVDALNNLGHNAVLDGEIVVLDREGKSRFQLIQNYQKTGKGNLVYYVFDLLYLDGKDLRSLPLTERKARLRKLLGRNPGIIHFSDHIESRGKEFFEAAVKAGMEGIIGKDGASQYVEGKRTDSWVKIKTRQRQEAVIGGFTAPRGRRVGIGALVLGVYQGSNLVYIGHTGGGLDDAGLTDLRERLDALVRDTCPFKTVPKTNAPVQWVEPQLVCEVEFHEWTDDGRMRQPIFVGLREDKPAREVRREQPVHIDNGDVEKADAEPKLTNLDKVYWPKEGYTKGDLIAYYREVAPVILPHLRDRPMSLNRHPDGIEGDNFFQKDVSHRPPPPWVETATIAAETARKNVTYVVCQNERTLLYLANLGCIELNPWLSRVGSVDRPDFLVIDLDPEDLPFSRVIEAAITVHKLLDRAGVEHLCKTSGKRGLHICVPLGARYDYEVARQFAQVVANIVHQQLPKSTSVVRSPALRRNRIYLDYLQNSRGQTLAAPYSVRPAPGAPVSTPLKWNEVRRGLDPAKFTIRTTASRLEKHGDLWVTVLDHRVDLEASLERLTRDSA